MMTKTVGIIFNLKVFSEELFYAIIRNDEKETNELKSKFEEFYFKQSEDMKKNIMCFINNDELVLTNHKLYDYYRVISN